MAFGSKKKTIGEDEAKKELVMNEHKLPLKDLYKQMNLSSGFSAATGMSDADVKRMLSEDGPNLLTPPPKEPEWKKFAKELFGFFACLLWIGGILCFVGYKLREDAENLYLGIVLVAVVTITATFSYFQNRKADKLMDSFKNMMPSIVTVTRGGKESKIDASQLVRGDIVSMKAGDKVAADCRVLEATDDAKVDNASLTGESEPQKRTADFTHDNPLETRNLCFFGTLIPSGKIKGIVVNTGDRTVMGRIAILSNVTDSTQSPINIEIEHFVHVVSAIAIFLGVTFFIVIMASPNPDAITALVFMIGIIVANVPEGLLATVTVCLTLTARRMADKMILVKNLEGVETLGSTTCICSDKTGTLTQNIMTVAEIVFSPDSGGAKEFHTPCSITPEGNYDANNESYKMLRKCATLCNNAVFDEDSKFVSTVVKKPDGSVEKVVDKTRPIPFRGNKTMGDGSTMEVCFWETIGDASESAMIKLTNMEVDITEFRKTAPKHPKGEVPFNSKNKYQLSVHTEGGVHCVYMKGAPERIIGRCNRVLEGGVEVPMTAAKQAEIEACQMSLSKKGLRILGFAFNELPPAQYPIDYAFSVDAPTCNFPIGNPAGFNYGAYTGPKPDQGGMVFCGLMALIDPPRPQVPGAVALCKTAGIKVIMVTGDHPITAKAIAYKVGILWSPTKEDIEEANEAGDGYTDPKSAKAIVVPGWDISVDTPVAEWQHILNHPQCVFARTSPQQKLIIVENCQKMGHIVAVTGDGVNDSPALKKADIGIAMGIMGSEVSKEAAKMILLDDNFASIVNGVEEGRLIFDNLKKSIAYTLSSNIPEISPFLVQVVAGVPQPLTTVLILCVDLGTDMVPAISMAYETAESDIMQRAPRNGKVDRLVTKKLVAFAYLQIGVIQAASGFFTWMVVLNDYGFAPAHLPGNGANYIWGRQVIYAKLKGGAYCNGGLDGDLRCVTAPTPSCRVVTSEFEFDPSVRSLSKFVNPYGATDQTKMEKCSTAFPEGWFAMPKNQVDGIFNCNPNMNSTMWDQRKLDGLPHHPEFSWYKRNCKGYRSELPIAWSGPYPLWRNGATMRGNVVDLAHALKNFGGSGAKGKDWPAQVLKSTIYDGTNKQREGKDAKALTRMYGYQDVFESTTAQAHAAAIEAGYVPYHPWASRMSPFYKQSYFWWPTKEQDPDQTATGLGAPSPKLFYQFQTVVGRFVANKKADYVTNKEGSTEPTKPELPTSGSGVNDFMTYDGEFDSQCQYNITSKDSICTNKDPSFEGGEVGVNYFVKTCRASVSEVSTTTKENISNYEWSTEPWYGSTGRKAFTTAFTTNAMYAKDNGACGSSNFIGHNGKEALNEGYQVLYHYPFVATDGGNETKGDGKNFDTIKDADANWKHAADGTNMETFTATNVFSRMAQKQALHHAQGAFWMCIVVVQWADLVICKTRWLSIVEQGMANDTMNFGLFFETLLAAYLAYYNQFQLAFGTRNIRATHWFPAMPFSMMIFGYDEARKFLMRSTSPVYVDKKSGQSIRTPGWLERNTYY
jgi:sodium/potassium-transporting ATPase subunit alpha